MFRRIKKPAWLTLRIFPRKSHRHKPKSPKPGHGMWCVCVFGCTVYSLFWHCWLLCFSSSLRLALTHDAGGGLYLQRPRACAIATVFCRLIIRRLKGGFALGKAISSTQISRPKRRLSRNVLLWLFYLPYTFASPESIYTNKWCPMMPNSGDLQVHRWTLSLYFHHAYIF